MPYIEQHYREQLDSGKAVPTSPGQLNYKISKLLKDYLHEHVISYGLLNDIVGAVEGAKQEFIRQVINPYEDQKIKTNGGLY